MEFEEWKEASDYYKEEQEAIKAKRFRKSRIPTMETALLNVADFLETQGHFSYAAQLKRIAKDEEKC